MKVGRPKNLYKTVSKTWMVYEDDIDPFLKSGRAAKDVFSLGLKAIEHGWRPNSSESEEKVTNLQNRIKTMGWTLESYVDKFNKLAQLIEKRFEIDIDPEVVDIKEIEAKLEKLDKENG